MDLATTAEPLPAPTTIPTLVEPAAHDDGVRSWYEERGPALLHYVLRLVSGDRQQAEDVVQETMLRAWRSGGGLDRTSSVRPWLMTVARRIVIDGHRRRHAHPPEASGEVLENMAGAEQREATLSRIVVQDALASLSAPHRQVIFELYFRRNNVDQAAQLLGIPPGTVRSRLHYALRALRLALAERGVEGRLADG